MASVFDNRTSCRRYLKDSLELLPDTEQFTEELLDVFAAACEIRKAERARQTGFEARIRRWVVRDDDLELFGAIKVALVSVVPAIFTLQDLSAGALTALAMGILKLMRNVNTSGVELTPEQVTLVAVLERHRGRPIAFDDLFEILACGKERVWTEERLRAELRALGHLPAKRGFVALVEVNNEDEWLLRGA